MLHDKHSLNGNEIFEDAGNFGPVLCDTMHVKIIPNFLIWS